MTHKNGQVEVWQENIVIPTYETGLPDKNPMFFEKRVYQGSSGKVYPYPVIEKIDDKKKEKVWQAVFLENDTLLVMILPELGGRIQRAFDKTNQYDFVYYNEVIKPALVGLTGPWISGGIEFNWPQHHRPTTFMPVDVQICSNQDGSKTVCLSETDQMYGTKNVTRITLYTDKTYIEIKGQLYNPTPFPQTFLWWANPAVSVNDFTQSIFPPDVHFVMDHGKRDVSDFPIATGTYYKQDYSAGVDISRYKNIPVPTSYMAYRSDFDFMGNYDHQKEAGILHIADHHISPGKKQWTWGCGDFGKAWDRNLTDKNGPYIEIMTGVFTDNQPDFTWLKPFEEKSFTQYFMPYKKVANVKNASKDIVLNLEISEQTASISVYASSFFENALITLSGRTGKIYECTTTLSPTEIFIADVRLNNINIPELILSVYDQNNSLLLSYSPVWAHSEERPEAAQPVISPESIPTMEELYLTGLHLEQYRHATFEPETYYLEGLRRDPEDSRINTAYGLLLLRRGLFSESEKHFRKAIERITWKNPNPYNSEPFYYLGVCLFFQERYSEAYDAFFKATWSNAEQEMSFFYLAKIATRKKNYSEALDFVNRSLIKNSHNMLARDLKAIILGKLNLKQEALSCLSENLEIDPFDYLSLFEKSRLDPAVKSEFPQYLLNNPQGIISIANDYASCGCYDEAVEVLNLFLKEYPLIDYYKAYFLAKSGKLSASREKLISAAAADPAYCFPNRISDSIVLAYAMDENPQDSKASYYFGNFLYDKKRYDDARIAWEKSIQIDSLYPTVWRNLAIVYFNKDHDSAKARHALETSFSLDQTDARVFFELDLLRKRMNVPPQERMNNFLSNLPLVKQRDDLYIEYCTLLNILNQPQEVLALIANRKFHPWEGGEGKITGQYKSAHIQAAITAMNEKTPSVAIEHLSQALHYPENLGEGKLAGTKDNDINYFLGCAHAAAGNQTEAQNFWALAKMGAFDPSGSIYYNDQPADMIFYQALAHKKTGNYKIAHEYAKNLIQYAENHIHDLVKIDYFAVSLPDLQLFDDDLTLKNQAHCYYLTALAHLLDGEMSQAQTAFSNVLEIDRAHFGAIFHQRNALFFKD